MGEKPGRVTVGGLTLAALTLALFLVGLAVRSGLVFGLVVVAAIFVPMERVFALRRQRAFRKGWATDLVHFVVNNMLTTLGLIVAIVAVGAALRAAVPQALRDAIAGQAALLQFAEALLITEISAYWGHRATHTVPVLWRFHKVHHSITEMDWLAAARLHPIDQAFTRSCAVIPLFVLGFSKATFGAFVVFTAFLALFIHANVRLTFGPLRWLIATPEYHHWHHSNDPSAYNSNFGEFPLVDAVFGTLHLPRHRRPERYGIDERAPEGYLAQLAWPFQFARGPR